MNKNKHHRSIFASSVKSNCSLSRIYSALTVKTTLASHNSPCVLCMHRQTTLSKQVRSSRHIMKLTRSCASQAREHWSHQTNEEKPCWAGTSFTTLHPCLNWPWAVKLRGPCYYFWGPKRPSLRVSTSIYHGNMVNCGQDRSYFRDAYAKIGGDQK